LFTKYFQELENEFNTHRSNSKPTIDTKGHKGDLSRYIPSKGSFNFINIDIDGKGGVCKIIEG
jgi:hypothetical protein